MWALAFRVRILSQALLLTLLGCATLRGPGWYQSPPEHCGVGKAELRGIPRLTMQAATAEAQVDLVRRHTDSDATLRGDRVTNSETLGLGSRQTLYVMVCLDEDAEIVPSEQP